MNLIYIDKLPESHSKEKIIKSLYLNGNLNVEFIYKSDFSNTKDLRDFIESIGVLLGLSNKFLSRIILISDELNNNAIEYGSDNIGFNKLRVISSVNEDGSIYFNLEVEDNGKGNKPKTALDMETLRVHRLKLGYLKHNSIRGRGLFLIIINIVDKLYFNDSIDGGLIVGIKVKI